MTLSPHSSGHGDIECPLSGEKDPELVQEVEWYCLGGFPSTQILGSGTQLLERGWTLVYSGLCHSELVSRIGL